MGSGASKYEWPRMYHITSNVVDPMGGTYTQIFPVWALAVTSNQRQLATATSDHRINLWCLVTQQLLIPLMGHADTIWCIAYSPDDVLLASASADGTVRLWEVNTGLPVMTLPRNHANWVWSLAWSPDGSRLATGGSDARILIWDAAQAAESARRVAEMSMMAEEDPSWADAASLEVQKAMRVSMPLLYWQAHEKSILDLTFAPSDPKMLVSIGTEGTLAVWDAESGMLDCRLQGHIGPINSVAISPESEEIVATAGEDHTVRLWDLRDIDPASAAAKISREKAMGLALAHFTLKGHEAAVAVVRFCGDGRLLASASKDCQVRVWVPNMQNPTLCAKFVAHEAWVRSLAWTADQNFLFTASSDGMVYAWQVPRKYHVKPGRAKTAAGRRYAA